MWEFLWAVDLHDLLCRDEIKFSFKAQGQIAGNNRRLCIRWFSKISLENGVHEKKQSPVSCTPTHWAAPAVAALTVTQHLNITVICALVSSNRNTHRWPDASLCETLIPAANQARFKHCEYAYLGHFSIYMNSKLNLRLLERWWV